MANICHQKITSFRKIGFENVTCQYRIIAKLIERNIHLIRKQDNDDKKKINNSDILYQ